MMISNFWEIVDKPSWILFNQLSLFKLQLLASYYLLHYYNLAQVIMCMLN